MLDRNGIVFGFRSDIPSWVTDEFLNQFADECRQYMKSCGRRSEEDIEANNRGNHWYMVVGIDRQNKPVSSFPPHTARRSPSDVRCCAGSPGNAVPPEAQGAHKCTSQAR